MGSIRLKPISVTMLEEVLAKFTRGEIERREFAAWSRAYVELMNDYDVEFIPADKTELMMDVIKETQSADLEINGAPIFTTTRAQVLLRRVKKSIQSSLPV